MHNTDRPTESVTGSGFWFDFLTSLHTYLNKHAQTDTHSIARGERKNMNSSALKLVSFSSHLNAIKSSSITKLITIPWDDKRALCGQYMFGNWTIGAINTRFNFVLCFYNVIFYRLL